VAHIAHARQRGGGCDANQWPWPVAAPLAARRRRQWGGWQRVETVRSTSPSIVYQCRREALPNDVRVGSCTVQGVLLSGRAVGEASRVDQLGKSPHRSGTPKVVRHPRRRALWWRQAVARRWPCHHRAGAVGARRVPTAYIHVFTAGDRSIGGAREGSDARPGRWQERGRRRPHVRYRQQDRGPADGRAASNAAALAEMGFERGQPPEALIAAVAHKRAIAAVYAPVSRQVPLPGGVGTSW